MGGSSHGSVRWSSNTAGGEGGSDESGRQQPKTPAQKLPTKLEKEGQEQSLGAASAADPAAVTSSGEGLATESDARAVVDAGTPPLVVYPQTLIPSSVLDMISTPNQATLTNQVK